MALNYLKPRYRKWFRGIQNVSIMIAEDSNATCDEYQDIVPNDDVDYTADDNGMYECDEFDMKRNLKNKHNKCDLFD